MQLKQFYNLAIKEHLPNTLRILPKLQLRPSIYMELFHGNMQQIALKPARIPWNSSGFIIMTSQ